ncbi:SRPBCC domain-containing protein [Uliginosibacterium sp. H1]|uniref:SRPBCC domain-containing protein n=1 Tax=Uliginosibacterium sp. H1 TaxID=3114757 RepID=UPI002E183244|nr:SRPBCC domain-containing protein [Uliginosibacterium sp. H1]
MHRRHVAHGTVSVVRLLPATPGQVFAAWADKNARQRWDLPGEDWPVEYERFDFRVGGRDRLRFGNPGGPLYVAEHCYHDIVPDARIVASRVTTRFMTHAGGHLGDGARMDGQRVFVGLVTAEFYPAEQGCRLVVTEQGAQLDDTVAPAGLAEASFATSPLFSSTV